MEIYTPIHIPEIYTAIPPQLYNIMAQTIFKGLLLTLVEVSNTVAVKKSYLLQKQLYIS